MVIKIISIPKVKIKDISINYNGEKIANVQSLKVKISREVNKIESFLESEPITLIPGNEKYIITVSRIYLNKELFTDYNEFYNMTDFSLVVSYPGKNIQYSNCVWANIEEDVKLEGIIEKAEIIAKNRTEIIDESENVSG